MARSKRDDPNPNGGKASRQKTAVGGRTSAGGSRPSATCAAAALAVPAMSDRRELELRRRVVIEGVRPEVEEGRFPAKGVIGESALVEADIYADGADAIAADVLYRRVEDSAWTRVPMEPLVNDRWRARIPISAMTSHVFTIEAWIDHFGSWRRDLVMRVEGGQDVGLDLLVGARLIEEALPRVPAKDAEPLRRAAAALASPTAASRRIEAALAAILGARMRDAADMRLATRYRRELCIQVDAPKAACSAWYEMFPRSASVDPKRSGTFRVVEARLPYVAGMGLDVLYLP